MLLFFFFFQAEDGIRDLTVTGVQTCAFRSRGADHRGHSAIDGCGGGSVMAHHGKRYEAARSEIDREATYSPLTAVQKLKAFPAAKFDETVEVHFRLGLNVRHADEQLRGTLILPHGTGKDVRIAVFAEGDKAREAEEAGADVVGSADLAKRIE